jgi:hypothetical protein
MLWTSGLCPKVLKTYLTSGDGEANKHWSLLRYDNNFHVTKFTDPPHTSAPREVWIMDIINKHPAAGAKNRVNTGNPRIASHVTWRAHQQVLILHKVLSTCGNDAGVRITRSVQWLHSRYFSWPVTVIIPFPSPPIVFPSLRLPAWRQTAKRGLHRLVGGDVILTLTSQMDYRLLATASVV